MKKTNNLIDIYKSWFIYWAIVGLGAFVLFFLVTSAWIGVSVKEKCDVAMGRYKVDVCVVGLMEVLDDEHASNREKNYAIWALGQLGDDRALPVLRKLYTGDIPDREPYDAGISQYELKKAIKLIDGGLNLTSFVWR